MIFIVLHEGIIVKALSGFYYVKWENKIIQCRARGKFKKDNIKPVVGDKVEFALISPTEGVIETIKERKNCLVRPSVANIDQLCLVFSAMDPIPDYLLMDRLTVLAGKNSLEVIICITKMDLIDKTFLDNIAQRFKDTGYTIIGISNKTLEGLEELKEKLKGKITTLSGPSGAGKSSLINNINPQFKLAVSSVSEKTKRGKHTTTFCQLLEVMENSFVVDTPGFTSLELTDFDVYELDKYFPEFIPFSNCRFTSCLHQKEEGCNIKSAVEKGLINPERYNSYLMLLEEIRENNQK
ncbi:ribosome small subunit-dependent GTPase A [Anaerobranca gottschalkii]|uniref:Small ribosomal subunit biogenesis GTPase RsgA n=1 Tax=Anaerobranca gottschalkii DSM 13577 TaxID=1120990 RepID=A0A1H9YXW9_9FIRM|nr:ribosome small subunit-dependent GTPase A [Anaerobranca gottschalkii]SES73950.1 ribosome biogenesis GTPase [Anaerobranca gottschalkii DSM 13577]